MDDSITVQPLPYRTRQRTFTFLLGLFLVSLPFLYLYATGYRFDFRKPTTLISTGGLYLAVDHTEAEIYIDNALVRETRTFRRAFYAQNLDVGTHRVHVQKEGYHTWVKELPVSKHLVTEATAFNMPVVPQIRVISPWQSATGTPIVRTPLPFASTTHSIIATTTIATTSLVANPEYASLRGHFSTTTPTTTPSRGIAGTTTISVAESTTSTVIANGVRLFMDGEELYATWVGSFENMPYYYCAADFPRYEDSRATSTIPPIEEIESEETEFVMHPLETVSVDDPCDPTIHMDRKSQKVRDFDFFPGREGIVIMALEDGIYAVEIDDRSWQNMQPLLLGEKFEMYLENGNVYVYDGHLIYQIFFNTELS